MKTENTAHPGPFLMAIDSGTNGGVNADEVAIMGRIVRGTAVVGSTLDLVGFAPKIKHVKLVEIRIRGMTFYVLQGATTSDIERGQVLAAPRTIRLGTTFEAEVVFDERYEKITQQPVQGIIRCLFHIWDRDNFGTLQLPQGKAKIAHGDRFVARIELTKPCALEVGLDFGIGRLLGRGRVTAVLS